MNKLGVLGASLALAVFVLACGKDKSASVDSKGYCTATFKADFDNLMSPAFSLGTNPSKQTLIKAADACDEFKQKHEDIQCIYSGSIKIDTDRMSCRSVREAADKNS